MCSKHMIKSCSVKEFKVSAFQISNFQIDLVDYNHWVMSLERAVITWQFCKIATFVQYPKIESAMGSVVLCTRWYKIEPWIEISFDWISSFWKWGFPITDIFLLTQQIICGKLSWLHSTTVLVRWVYQRILWIYYIQTLFNYPYMVKFAFV